MPDRSREWRYRAGQQMSLATRNLCAGVYIDPDFRDRALDDIYARRGKRVAPSYGFDLVPVLVSALQARRLHLSHDLLCALIALYAVIAEPLAALFVAGALGVAYVGRMGSGLGRDYLKYWREKHSYSDLEYLRFRGRILTYIVLPSFALLGLSVLAITVVGDNGAWPLRGGFKDVIVIVLAFGTATLLHCMARHVALMRLRHSEHVGARVPGRRLSVIDAQQQHPFVVYAGYRPFVGSGEPMLDWSFAQRLIKSESLLARLGRDGGRQEEFESPPFKTVELVSELEDAISNLSSDDNPETRLPGLTTSHRVFVETSRAKAYAEDLFERPSDGRIEEIIADSGAAARHYLTCQVESWEGEIVTSVYVHVSLQGRTLYLHFNAYALAPTPREYQVLTRWGGLGSRMFLRSFLAGLSDLPMLAQAPRRLGLVPGRILATVLSPADRTRAVRRGFDIGTEISLREVPEEDEKESLPFGLLVGGEPGEKHSFFQLADLVKHIKIIERRLVSTVSDFLVEHEVDTSEFETRITAILNNGVINTGSGDVDATESVMGSQHTVQRPVASE